MRSLPPRVRRFGTHPVSLAACLLLLGATLASAAPHFTETAHVDARYPAGSRTFDVALDDMAALLRTAPLEDFTAMPRGLTIELPLPGGATERFEIWEAPIMHPDLAARYPEIRTYRGLGLDDATATIRLDTTEHGFHAMILSTRPTVLIDPIEVGNARTHVSYVKRTPRERGETTRLVCHTDPTEAEIREARRVVNPSLDRATTGPELLTYRAAIACTGEYAQFHGGTVSAALAAINTTLNRVVGIYEREVSIRMELIPNNDQIIYTNGGTDPYSNFNGFTMLGQNQSNLDSVIGSSNYDIGHVVSTGGGGIASLGVVCRVNNKARGVTGLESPVGDQFDVDYVSHEMGHQFAATHTFNGTSGSCAGNRTSSTAYEPGSGTTIMAYAGICGSQDIAIRAHDNFHGASFDQITTFVATGWGSTCPVVTSTGNNPPVATAGNAGLTIPIETPFILYGSHTEPDGDEVTYNWEEFDLGPAGHPNSPSGNAPIFRAFPSRTREWRMFPKQSDVRNNAQTLGELLPTYTRRLTFRLTVRDNLGGVGNDTVMLDVNEGAGPFVVTSVGATPWDDGQTRTITWDVANTDAAPVSVGFVNILLSDDDGREFTTVLVANTPNDGSETITVPSVETLEARVQVEAVGNVFFDMNDDHFEIIVDATSVDEIAEAGLSALEVRPNPFTGTTRVAFALERRAPVSLNVYDAAGRRVAALSDGMRDVGRHTVEWTGRDTNGAPVAAGVYFIRMETPDEVKTVRSVRLK